MSGTVLLVTHSAWRESRVSPMLQAKGYAVEWCCPAKGERLPDDPGAYAGAPDREDKEEGSDEFCNVLVHKWGLSVLFSVGYHE